MALFLSTYVNRIDRKGRVSVPAPYRALLTAGGYHSFVVFPHVKHTAIECRGMDFMEQLFEQVDSLDPFSDERETLSLSIFPDSEELAFDPEGRVVLPEKLRTHAGIDERVIFVGMGRTFQIWEPDQFAAKQAEARAQAPAAGLLLRKSRSGGAGT